MANVNQKGTAREVLNGMARAFFCSAFADAYDEAPDSSKKKRKIGSMAGRDFEDVLPRKTDAAAFDAANDLAQKLQRENGVKNLADLYHKAMDAKEFFRGDRDLTPRMFGHYLAMQAMGHGVGLVDAFGQAVAEAIEVPYQEFGLGSLDKEYF